MAENLYRAWWAFLICVIVIFIVSLFTKAKPESELDGLVYGATILAKEEPVPFYKNVYIWAVLAVIIFAALNILFW
jgi:SSS family solute:Na+ symporter